MSSASLLQTEFEWTVASALADIEQRGPYAASAIEFCERHPDGAAPALLKVLDLAARGVELTPPESELLFVGVHLLGAARNPNACRPLLNLLRRPDQAADRLLGDAVTEALPGIAIGVFDGDADALFDALRDPAADEFVRSSLFEALAGLAMEGKIARQRTIDFLASYDEQRPVGDEDFAWCGWSDATALLGLEAFEPRILAAIADGRIDKTWFGFEHWREDLDATLAGASAPRNGGGRLEPLADAAGALAPYARVRESDAAREPREKTNQFEDYEPDASAANPMRGVGRNDPCPCGSGAKAKKCCLSATSLANS